MSVALTPMMRQYLEIKERHADAILFFRMGDFYEMFFEDARTAAPVLGVALTSRDKRPDGEGVPLCGVPWHALDHYLTKMTRAGFKVAICEQIGDPKAAKGIVEREVVRVVTPGLTLAESTLEAGRPNYLVAFQRGKVRGTADGKNANGFGLAVMDFSTGEFRATETDDPALLWSELGRLAPSEILLAEGQGDEGMLAQLQRQFPQARIQALPPDEFNEGEAERRLTAQFRTRDLSGFGLGEFQAGLGCAGALMGYVRENERGRLEHIQRITSYDLRGGMALDGFTRRNLELTNNLMDGGRAGTLLGRMDRTCTAMGARTLRQWITLPLADVAAINARLDSVEALVSDPDALDRLREGLKGVLDIERLLSRIVTGTANARDLRALAASLAQLPIIAAALDRVASGELVASVDGFDCHAALAARLDQGVAEEPPATIREGGIIRSGFNADLDDLREVSRSGRASLAKFEAGERERTGLPVKVGYNKVFGYFIELTNKHKDQTPAHYIRKQTLVGAERFITEELKQWEEKILTAKERADELEYKLFQDLRTQVIEQGGTLSALALTLGRVDALASLAALARQAGFVRPEMHDGFEIEIEEGRHPVIEALDLGERFVPNDCRLAPERRILLITGPNMAGKSTYMRQVALIVLMAQAGSFIPASHARIGVADRIFTRVGASDQLSQGLSTFMVEMRETAEILNHATARSLVVLDEIGRGTSTYDGLSIAWSVMEHLHDRTGCKCLFATHYHELAEVADLREAVSNVHVAVKEWEGEVIFLRRILEGASPHSYGIKVARLAGLPREVLLRAEEILANLEEGEQEGRDRLGRPKLARKGNGPAKPVAAQMTLFDGKRSATLDRLKNLDPEKLTPLEALNLLAQLRQDAHNELD